MHLILIFLLITNVFTVYLLLQDNDTSSGSEFELLSPQVARLEVDEFLEKQDALSASYFSLKNTINSTIIKGNGNYSVYVEDLTTGAWIGINEKVSFVPASLVKVPVVVGVMNRVQDGEISLNDQFELIESDIDCEFGDLCEMGVGYKTTIGDLVQLSLKESDNTAHRALLRLLDAEKMQEAAVSSGINMEAGRSITTKQYSNVFRSLYYSTYLRRPFSEYILSEMIETPYEDAAAAGLPSDVKFSHKIGVHSDNGILSMHDCGIVYLPKKPYLFCVMTRGVQQEQAKEIISQISKTTFEYMERSIG